MRVIYTGDRAAVVTSSGVLCERDTPVTVSTKEGRALAQRPDFERAKAPAKTNDDNKKETDS